MPDLSAYQRALESAAIYKIKDPGYLSIRGNGKVDFLQRQTTNDLRQLDATHTLTSVLTTPNARIVDVFRLLIEGENIGVLTLPGRGASTAGFLRGRIFFNDDVSLEDHSQDFDQIILQGNLASDLLATLDVQVPGLGEISQVDIDEFQGIIIGHSGKVDLGFRLLFPSKAAEKVTSILEDGGAVLLGEETYHVLRVENGIPGAQGELTEDFTPLEVGLLGTAISQTKGCYTGQEVIARQVNFDKITRSLVGLRLSAVVKAGQQVRVEGKPAGQVTSVVKSPRFGEIALAVVKRPYNQTGTKVNIGDIEAVVVDLPFS